MDFNSISLLAWLLQTLLVILICAGVDNYYHHMWRFVFIRKDRGAGDKFLSRLLMFIISAGTGLITLAGAHFGILGFGDSPLFLATAVFALSLPLLNKSFNIYELIGQLLTIGAGVALIYWGQAPVRGMVALVLAVAIAIFAYAVRTDSYKHTWSVLLVLLAMGVAFIAPLQLPLLHLTQIFGSYLFGILLVALLWDSTLDEDTAVTEHTAAVIARKNKPEEPKHEYTFFVQRMVDATGDKPRTMAYELLLREWNESEQRWSVPNNFEIPIDEQIELMKKVLTKTGNARLSLNLNARQFVDAHTSQALVAFAQNYDQLDGLIIELTHAPSIADMRRISPLYHQVDIRIAIDGVGSDNHFESLQGVFPYIDGLKFALQKLRKDKDVNNLDERLGFWYSLAAEYDIDFIMEGIEDQADVDYVKNELQVQYLQGYMYGRPDLPENIRGKN